MDGADQPISGTCSMYGELVPCGGGDPIPLLKTKLLIGRRSRCDIALDFPNVSSHHCELEFQNGYWFVRDLGSRNGIKVNAIRHDSKFLMPGDVLSVAKHLFEIKYTPLADGPPPDEENPFARSLMERAGLSRTRDDSSARPDRSTGRSPASSPPPPVSKTSDADDLAMKFLTDDE